MMVEKSASKDESIYDVVIVGAGPAGLTAAIYLARARYSVLLLEQEQIGGQITITQEVVNYPGIKKISGKELTDIMKLQAESFGAKFAMAKALTIKADDAIKTVCTNKGDFKCISVLLATGAHPRTVGFKGEDEFKGRGVAYCATCDGEFFTGKEIFVIGGGYAAAEESVFLTKFAKHVTILIRKDDFSCAASVSKKAKENEKITVLYNTVVKEVSGNGAIDYIRFENTKSGEEREFKAEENDFFGVFVLAGYSPNSEFVKDIVSLNENGYIETDESKMTTQNGVFACGDVCVKPLRQVVTATGDAALAATEIEKYVAKVQKDNNLYEKVQEKPPIDAKAQADSEKNTFSDDINGELKSLFSKIEHKLTLKLFLDTRAVSDELLNFVQDIASISQMIDCEICEKSASSDFAPCVKVFSKGKDTGISFHGVPGGHEFTSFVLSLYNAGSKGQQLDNTVIERINSIKNKTNLKILVSLSCTMCPDLVIACQYIAAKNENVSAEVYDVNHFEKLRSKYRVMSVPCLIIDDSEVYFGKKSIDTVLELIEKRK